MPKWAYLLIAIAIIIVLLIIFFVSFVAYRRLPTPKGCEDLEVDEKHCAGCSNITCEFHNRKPDNVERKEK